MPTIFSDCAQISVNGSSLNGKPAQDKYERDVIAVLKGVYANTWTATAVIDAVGTAGKAKKTQVVIVPLTGALASAGPDNPRDAAPKDVTRYSGARDDPSTRADERYGTATGKGTGVGSNSHIAFDPKAEDPEKTIVHELLHSLREMLAQFNQVPTETVLSDYENREEFFAMLIGNTYLSEVGREDLRASHIVYKELPADMKTSTGFLQDSAYGKACRRLLNTFILDNGDVAEIIKNHVHGIKFNPIREFIVHRGKYPLA